MNEPIKLNFVSIDPGAETGGACAGILTFHEPGVEPEIEITTLRLHRKHKVADSKKVRVSSQFISNAARYYSDLLGYYNEHQADVMLAEIPSGGAKSSSAQKSLALCTTVLACLTCNGVNLVQIAPNEVKNTVLKARGAGGSKKVPKSDVAKFAYERHPDLEWEWGSRIETSIGVNNDSGQTLLADFEHAADAIAIAYTALKHPETEVLINAYRMLQARSA